MQHVGSTSIPGLESKPIIDIVIGVKKLDDGFNCIEPLANLGYQYKGSLGESKRFFFSKGDEKNKTHHVHIVEYGDKNWENQILLRDYLLQNKDAKDEYETLKRTLAKEYADDRETYASKKVEFILETIKQARMEKGSTRRGI
ncbi:GrpB family protein [Proteiniborus sp. MB09-C3]|uniref:GrpB family protein n=1 Tax=Proteiniborus sp. MB09-C3 TaxID=3050072 RepID=UPI003329A948